MKPVATLTITRTASGADSYRLYHGSEFVWSTRAYATVAGRDVVRERLRQWLVVHPYRVELAEHQKEVG